MFAHNGDLKSYAPRLHGAFKAVGTTDSEQAFCWLLQEMAKSHASLPSIEELSLTLRELVPQITRQGTFNFLLSNGDALWAHSSTHLHYLERKYPFNLATLADEDMQIDFSTQTTPTDRVSLVVTQPLTKDEPWIAFQPGELKVFKDGQVYC